jgi:vancomycin resistance protein YoaR
MSVSTDPRRYYASARGPQPASTNPWLVRLPLLIVSGLLLIFFIMIASLAGYQYMYQDKVYPGVSTVYGLDLTGLTRAEVRAALQDRFTYAKNATFVFHYQGQSWEYTAEDLGVELDLDATVDAVFDAGRSGGAVSNLWDQWTIWRNGQPVSPIITYNQSEAERLVRQLASNYINQPMLDATLTIRDGRAVATPSQIGREVDVQSVLDTLRQEILSLSVRSEINLTVRETAPTVWEADTAAQLVNIALDLHGVTFFVPAEAGEAAGPWTATAESIENMLRIERVENGDGTAHYEVRVVEDQVRAFLEQISPDLRRTPVNARFVFNDDTRQLEVIQPSQRGRDLNVEATLSQFQTAVFSIDNRSIPLTFTEVMAPINESMTAAELGITEEVVSATTYFVGSTAARRTNIQVAASRFHGLVIPPNSIFSFNEWLGDVSPETGFEEGLIIYGNQTITGVGGGVCQVSTTAFQAAFYAGFPILDRVPHGYRVGYYETGEGPGMDATVFSPIVDFRFKNDTPYHLLIETYFNPNNSTLTFKYYSTSMGRKVIKEGPYVRNVRPAPPAIYRATPGVTGTVQVDYAVSGAEVYVYRTVLDVNGNTIIDREEFYSNYIPWPAQYQVSPNDPRANG